MGAFFHLINDIKIETFLNFISGYTISGTDTEKLLNLYLSFCRFLILDAFTTEIINHQS
jgi:hypothetical protein